MIFISHFSSDALRDRLKDVNWARAGLGLPLLEKREERRPQVPRPSTAGGGGGLTMSSSSSSLSSAPTGPRPAPEGGIQTSSLGGGEQGAGVHMSGGSGGGGGDGGSNFDTATSRKTGGELSSRSNDKFSAWAHASTLYDQLVG